MALTQEQLYFRTSVSETLATIRKTFKAVAAWNTDIQQQAQTQLPVPQDPAQLIAQATQALGVAKEHKALLMGKGIDITTLNAWEFNISRITLDEPIVPSEQQKQEEPSQEKPVPQQPIVTKKKKK